VNLFLFNSKIVKNKIVKRSFRKVAALLLVAVFMVMSETSIAFGATKAPAPKLRPSTVMKNTETVVVIITEWGNAVGKEYKIDNGSWQAYTGPITLIRNAVVYARGIDSSNVKSSVASLTVNNIFPNGGGPIVENPGDMKVIYVAPNAINTGAGSIESPMAFTEAITKVAPGGTIYMRGGKYEYNTQKTIEYGNNGTAEAMKSIIAYDNEKPVLDFSSQPYNSKDPSQNARGLQIDGDYWHVKGLEFYGSADNGLYIGGSHNKIELCVANANRDTGIQLGRRFAGLPKEEGWPSYNLILNSTSYNNADPDNGEDADGFAAKLTIGDGNVFDGCIAYNNVDDGWDLYTKTDSGPIGSVTIKNSVAFNNGMTTNGTYSAGSDGNGFKLGGSGMDVDHFVENTIAFNNKAHGFTDNSNPGTITLTNCTSFNNSRASSGAKSNFDFARATNSHNVFINLLSFTTGGVASDKYRGTATNSVFYNSGNYYRFTDTAPADQNISTNRGTQITAPTASEFVSLTAPSTANPHVELRNADGSVNLGTFLKLAGSTQFKGLGASLHGN
jgi:hypothetical protein